MSKRSHCWRVVRRAAGAIFAFCGTVSAAEAGGALRLRAALEAGGTASAAVALAPAPRLQAHNTTSPRPCMCTPLGRQQYASVCIRTARTLRYMTHTCSCWQLVLSHPLLMTVLEPERQVHSPVPRARPPPVVPVAALAPAQSCSCCPGRQQTGVRYADSQHTSQVRRWTGPEKACIYG